MTFNIRQLDKLAYEDAEPLLEDYIHGLMDAFVESQVGQVHVEKYPEGGGWIGTFIEMGFNYLDKTPSQMTLRDAQTLMQQILPRKLVLMDATEADDAIPELMAFWEFLQNDYKLRSAGAIRKYLRSIKSEFRHWMGDESRGGFVKQFAMQGMAAGFDMTTQEGIEAFQDIYNQQLQSSSSPTPSQSKAKGKSQIITPTNPFPSELDDDDEFTLEDAFTLLEVIKDGMPPELANIDPATLIQSLLTGQLPASLDTLGSNLGSNIADLVDRDSPVPSSGRQSIFRDIDRSEKRYSELAEPLSPKDIATLKAQTITDGAPGTILTDFQTLLDWIGPDGIATSGKLHHFPQKSLADINQRLSHPIDIDLKRPLQKSYPNVNGLYLLLRASGLGRVETHGKASYLKLDPDRHEQWQQFNPTERYFALLEAWLVRAVPDLLGDTGYGNMTEGDFCLGAWRHTLSTQSTLTFDSYAKQQDLSYYPRLSNLALMGMFGFVSIEDGKPEAGKGWRIQNVTRSPWGDAVFALFTKTFLEHELVWGSESDPALPLNELQPAFQPYFPEWQQSLTFVSSQFRPDIHLFKVSLGKIWRQLAIAGDATLYDLSLLIVHSVDFDNDHLHAFTYHNEAGRPVEIFHPYYEDDRFSGGTPSVTTNNVKIGDIPLKIGDKMTYLFDFGDNWEFQVILESLEPLPADPAQRPKTTGEDAIWELEGKIMAAHGRSPKQYE